MTFRFSLLALGLVFALPRVTWAQTAAPPAVTSTPDASKPLSESLSGLAKAEYAAAKVLFEDRDFASALLKFQSAHDASKDPRLLWNVAACQKELRRYAKVLATLERYKAEGAAMLSEQDKREVDEVVSAITPLVSPVKFAVNEAGAMVTIDDEAIGTTPLKGAVRVDIGSRRVIVRKTGFVAYDQTLTVRGSGEVEVNVKLIPEVHEGTLIVRAGSKDTVYVDGRMVGGGRWEGKIPAGGHTLRVTSPGMRPFQSEVVIQDGQTRMIDVPFEPESKAGSPWPWIIGGALLASGAGVGSFFLFRPSDQPAPPPAAGTIQPGVVQMPLLGN